MSALLLATACTSSGGPVDVTAPTPPAEGAEDCRRFLEALPAELDGLANREVEPADASARAWGDPAVVVSCGGTMPEEFDEFSTCAEVDGVGWFAPEGTDQDPSADAVLTSIHVEPVVEVRVPAEHRPPAGILVLVGEAVRQELAVTGSCA